MQKGEFKKILFETFDVLEFSEEEKQEALESFKKKLANVLLNSVRGELPDEQQSWIKDHMTSASSGDSKIAEIQNSIRALYSLGALHEQSRTAFKKILKEYIDFMSKNLDLKQEQTAKLREIVGKF